ncbi:MAG: cytochrome C peroxidase [Nitrospira sp. WS110]|nr:cytochrome C peroxidase [Nitrospira sp. WS110]
MRVTRVIVGLGIVSILCTSTLYALTGDGTIPRVLNPPAASDLSNLPGDLRAVPVPGPSDQDLAEYVKDKRMAIALGKAFFWDMQIGSDGIQACASCHFRAGADPRSKNQLSPGLKHVPQQDLNFKIGGPNYQLTSSGFPLTRLAIAGQRGALDQATDNNDVVSSQGVPYLDRGPDPLGYQVGRLKTRRVEPRNTPSMINAVFNHRQFWDGRAENIFNGVNPFGARDPEARVMASAGSNLVEVQVALVNSSLASQAVGPIVSEIEMAAPGRTHQDIARDLRKGKHSHRLGKRVHGSRPLQRQLVDPSDSVLGPLSRYPARGLRAKSYDEMIQAAFQDKYWQSEKFVQVAEDGTVSIVDQRDRNPNTEEFTLLEYNFALFFGLAVQLYEATLVSDDTPWDRFRRDHPSASDPALNPWTNTNPNHITRFALFGAHLFNDRTRGPNNLRCSNCHESAELTDASVRRISLAANGPVRNRDGNVIDKGFNNIGVRPTDDDLGVGASDAFGPLSHSKRLFPDGPPASFDGAAVTKGFGIEGAFKIPSLRNVALTAPYFHNGDTHSLREAVLLYSRGGNVAPLTQRDGTPIEPLGIANMTSDEVDAVVAWLESLTDERVRIAAAPFDHPQLFVPNGHPGNQHQVEHGGRGFAKDDMVEIPMTGAAGGPPLPGFLEGVFGPH